MHPSLVYRFTPNDGLLLKSSLHFQISPDLILRSNLQHMPPIEQRRDPECLTWSTWSGRLIPAPYLDVSGKGAVPHPDSRDCTIFAIHIENINNFMTTIGRR